MVEFRDFGIGVFNLLVGSGAALVFIAASVFIVFATLTTREEWLAKRDSRLRYEEEAAKK